MATGRVPTTANSPLTTKGDLFGYSTAPARLAVGSDGDTIVADSSTATGLSYQANWAAGKNKIINGAFNVWQRGTTGSPSVGGYQYASADRWFTYVYASGASTISQQTFTPGTAPVAGYEGQFFARFTSTNTSNFFGQRIEDVRTFAGQTVTLSFWAKSASAQTLSLVEFEQNFGSGGSASVYTSATAPSVTTSWARYSITISIPSISGKTVGTSSFLQLGIKGAINNALDIWGVQVEAGSVATAFQTATGTIQGELAACQRYYFRQTGGSPASPLAAGYGDSTTRGVFPLRMPVTMRIEPNAIEYSSVGINFYGAGQISVTSLTLDTTHAGPDCVLLVAGVASGLVQYRPYDICTGSTGYVGLSAEL